jgi:AcrR family transcriptional regulator
MQAIARGGNIACDLEIMRCRISILHKRLVNTCYAGQNNKATASEETGRGQRAGLTRDIILAKAVRLLHAGGGGLSMRTLAKALGVQSRTVHSHFKGGLDELGVALAQKALADVARPLKPRDTRGEYIRELFRTVLAAVHGQSALAKIVALELSHNYSLNPLVPERILVALTEAEVPDKELALSLEPLAAIFVCA